MTNLEAAGEGGGLDGEECRCGGNCYTCLDAVGADPEVWCPYCTVHASQEEWDAARANPTA